MSYKWNSADAKTYAKAFSQLICNEYFDNRAKISGSEILKLTEIKQLNLMVVRTLYEKWLEDTAKFKSPFFDFDNEDVQKAFKDFKNILSRHISVNKDHFEEVLIKAVYSTLELNLNTENYFEGLMKDLPEFKLTKEWLKINGKYFISHNWVLAELLNRLQGMPVVYANQAIDWVKDILNSNSSEKKNIEIEQFNAILPIPFSDNYSTNSGDSSFFDDAFLIQDNDHSTISLKQMPVVSNDERTQNEEIFTPAPIHNPEPIAAEFTSPAIAKRTMEEPVSLNDKHLGSTKTLNERMVKEEVLSLSDNHSKGKITSIRSVISLNQRFLFINNLFGGNVQAFTNAIDQLESASSFSVAKETMLKKYLPQYKWDIASPEAEEFFDILRRRFN